MTAFFLGQIVGYVLCFFLIIAFFEGREAFYNWRQRQQMKKRMKDFEESEEKKKNDLGKM